jgi:glycosyltransferase involved in cell wall biosynthesis
MVDYPKISIITPSFNQGQYLEQTIQSVIQQNYPNLEYIIIDGGSSDNTLDLISKYERNIYYWVSESDSGQSNAINKGLQKATGEIINWLNSDDLLTEQSLFEIAKEFRIYNPDILCGYCDYFSSDPLFNPIRHRTFLCKDAELTLLKGEINQPSMFYKASIFKDLAGVNNDLNCVMDLDLFYRYLLSYGQHKIKLSDKLFSKFRIHNASKTSSLENRFIDERKILLNSIISVSDLPERLKHALKYNDNIFNNYNINNRFFNTRKCLLHIIHEKYFDVYRKGDYVSTLAMYFRLLFSGKNLYSKSHMAVAFKSLINSLK